MGEAPNLQLRKRILKLLMILSSVRWLSCELLISENTKNPTTTTIIVILGRTDISNIKKVIQGNRTIEISGKKDNEECMSWRRISCSRL